MILVHGHARKFQLSPTYRSWIGMRQRCNNPNNLSYPDYGGRGIKVCGRWDGQHGFENFLKDMGVRPSNKTLDRRDSNGDYTPNNCRWATSKEQATNKRPEKRKGLGSIRGVCHRPRLKNKPWQAIAKIGDSYVHVGYFATEEEAIKAREERERKVNATKTQQV